MSIKVLLLLPFSGTDESARLAARLSGSRPPAIRAHAVPTVESALAALESEAWDAALIDAGSPSRQGVAAIERVHRQHPKLPIIALIDKQREEMAADAVKAGAQDCLARSRLDGSLLQYAIRCVVERAHHDIADQAVGARQTRHRNFESLVNRSPAVFVVWRVADGCYPVEFVSENVDRFGHTAEEIMAACDSWSEITHPDDLARIRSETADYISTGVREFCQNYRIRTKSGEFRWIESRSLVLPDETGRVTHIQGMVLDITDQRLVQRRYESTRDELHAVCDAALDAVIMMDTEGKVALWNPAAERMFGWRSEEICGQAVHDLLMPPEYRRRANERLRQFARRGTGPAVGKVLELSALRKDGSRFPIEISVAPIRLEQGWGAVAIIRDITKRKWAEEAVARQQRQLRQALEVHERDCALVADELHDGFVQPLAAALMNLEALLAELNDRITPAARRQYADAIQLFRGSIGRARQLMTRLRPSILDEFGLVSAIESLVDEAQQTAGPTVTCSCELEDTRLAPPLEIALYRVVQEGLTNAQIHSKCGNVRLRIAQLSGIVRAEIEDDGIGFDPDRIADGCYGLEGIRQRAKALGGRAIIQSAPGAGTRILFELPLSGTGPLDDDAPPD